MVYNEMVMPFAMVPFEEMKKKQAEQYFRWFISTLDERCTKLENYIKITGGEVVLDKTPESLIGLWEWFEPRIGTTLKNNKELERELEESNPMLRYHVLENVNKLSAETIKIAWDMATYFGEVVRNNNPHIYWGYCSAPKKLNGVNRPQLFGFAGGISVYVYGRIEVGIWKSLREKNKMCLYDMYVVCKDMM